MEKKRKKKKVSKISNISKKDKEFTNLIRKRDKVCQFCGSKEYLNVCHIIPREDLRFRWDPANGILLCAKHHKFDRNFSFHRNPFMFFLWFIAYRRNQFEKLLKNIIKISIQEELEDKETKEAEEKHT